MLRDTLASRLLIGITMKPIVMAPAAWRNYMPCSMARKLLGLRAEAP